MALTRKNTATQINGDDPMLFCMSDGSVDRMGDIVEADGWDLSEFKRNPICLANHDPAFPIGKWSNIRVEGSKLLGHLTLAPAGTSARIDEIRKLVFAGILKSCSVGFMPIETAPLPKGGTRFKKARLVECSVVATPANANALMSEAKLLGISNNVIQRVIGRAPVNGSIAQRAEHARSMMRGKAEADAIARRAYAKVRADQEAKQRAIDEEAEQFRIRYMRCRTDDERIAFLISDKAKTEARENKARDPIMKRKVEENRRKVGGMISFAKSMPDRGTTPEDVMKAYLRSIEPRRYDY